MNSGFLLTLTHGETYVVIYPKFEFAFSFLFKLTMVTIQSDNSSCALKKTYSIIAGTSSKGTPIGTRVASAHHLGLYARLPISRPVVTAGKRKGPKPPKRKPSAPQVTEGLRNRGRKRLASIQRAKTLANRLIKKNAGSLSEYARNTAVALEGGEGDVLRHAAADHRFMPHEVAMTELQHHVTYNMYIRLHKQVEKIIDMMPTTQVPSFYDTVIGKMCATAKAEMASILVMTTPLSASEVRDKENMMRLLKLSEIVPQSGFFSLDLGAKEIADSVEVASATITHSVNRLSGNVTELNDLIRECTPRVEVAHDIKLPGPVMLTTIYGMYVALCKIAHKGKDAVVQMASIVLETMSGFSSLPSTVWDAMNRTIAWVSGLGMNGIIPQASEDYTGAASDLLTWIPAALGDAFSAAFKAGGYVKTGAQLIASYMTGIKGFHSAITAGLTLGREVLKFIISCLGYDHLLKHLVSHPIIMEAKEFMDELSANLATKQHIVTLAEADRIRELVSEIREAMRLATSKHPDYGTLSKTLERLSRVQKTTEAVYARTKSRVVPPALMLFGPPGVGKTTVLMEIINALIILSSPTIEKLNQISEGGSNKNYGVWNANSVSSYCDGLKSGDIVVNFDEFGVEKDNGTGAPASISNFTGMVNSIPFNPEMAAVEEKGKIVFAPYFVTGTTNVRKFGPEELKSIKDPKAITRRITHPMKVTARPECADSMGRICEEKVRLMQEDCKSRGVEAPSPSVIHRYNFDTGSVELDDRGMPIEVSVDDIILSMHRLRQARVDFHNATLAKNKSASTKYVDMRRAELTGQGGSSPLDFVQGSMARMFTREINFEWSDIIDDLKARLPLLATLTSLVALTVAGIAAVKLLTPRTNYQSATTVIKGKNLDRRLRGARRLIQKPKNTNTEQASLAYTNVIGKVGGNLFEVYIGKLGAGKRVVAFSRDCLSLCIGGSTFMFPAHVYTSIEEKYDSGNYLDAYVEFRKPNCLGSGVVVDLPTFLQSAYIARENDNPLEDKVYIKLPDNSIAASRRITHMFIDHHRGGKCLYYTIRGGEPYVEEVEAIPKSCAYNGYVNDHTLYYPINTQAGDCGSLLFGLDSAGQLGIVAFHVAGRNDSSLGGFGQTFSSAVDAEVREKVVASRPFILHSALETRVKYEADTVSTMEVVGKVKAPPPVPYSRIIAAPLYNEYGLETGKKPANLRPFMAEDGTKVVPIENARNRYSHNAMVIDPIELQTAKDAVFSRIINGCSERTPHTTISIHEALSGPGHMNIMNRKSSVGAVEALLYNATDKTPIMGSEGPVDTSAPMYAKFAEDMDELLQQIVEGKAPTPLFKDFLKDEVLANDKVDAGRDRKVAARGMQAGVVARMAYWSAMDTLINPKNLIFNGSAVGINPAADWANLVGHVLAKGDGVFCTDFRSWDASMSHQIMRAAFEVLSDIAPTTDADTLKYREWIADSICSSTHLDDRYVTVWSGSNPSGNDFTTVLNNIVQAIAMQLTISRHVLESDRHLVDLPAIIPRSGFTDHASQGMYEDQFKCSDPVTASVIMNLYRLVTFGDDGIMSVRPELNMTTGDLARHAKAFGFVLTNADKTDPLTNPLPPQSIVKASFLKRGFRYEMGRWTCPLERESIYKSLAFTKKNYNREDYERVVHNAALEFSMHGEEVWTREHVRLLNACAEAGVKYDVGNYSQCAAEILTLDWATWVG